ncbi:MAG: HEAT repeat domain-containing protein, partial [Chloroflexota bacterium]|nr:HEAT repeat domain-containing protein [Chloroflexota bacterium]
MELTGPDSSRLQAALLDAFRSKAKLDQMLRPLNVRLNNIVRDGSLEEMVYEVLDRFDARGKLDDLIAAACEANPSNRLLRPFCDGLVPPPELRAAYAQHLREVYDRADLRGLVTTQHSHLHAVAIGLDDIYVPLRAGVVDHRRVSLRMEEPPEREPGEDTGATEGERRERRERAAGPLRRERVAVDDLVANAPVAVILGDPGSGKSTALKHYALGLLADPAGPLPLMVSLAAYAAALVHDPNLSIEAFAAAFYAARGVAGLEPLFAWARRTGRLVYLLDGLDEVAGAQRGQVSAGVAALARGRGANRVLATSRITGYIPLPLDEYAEATLDPLDAAAQAAFAGKWYAIFARLRGDTPALAERTAAALLAVIRDNPGVAKLADNPLTLTMLALLFFAGNANLPRERVRLYGEVARTLIEEWCRARNLVGMQVGSTQDELTVLKRVGPLAYTMHADYPSEVMPREAVAHILAEVERKEQLHGEEDPMPAVRLFLDRLSTEVGLLTEKGPDQWAFSHRTFQEYFTARQIARSPSKMAAEIAHRARDPQWTEVIRLAIAYHGSVTGDTEGATDLVQDAILHTDDPYEPYLHRHLLLAGRVVSDDPGIDRRVALQVVQQIFDLWLDTNVDALAESAGEVLRDLLKVPHLRDILLEQVLSALAANRYIDDFGVLAEDVAVQAALLGRMTDADSSGRETGARALAGVAGEAVVQAALLGRLTDASMWVRQAAVQALATVAGEAEVQAALLGRLTDVDNNVRAAAVGALAGVAGVPEVQVALLGLLTDADSSVRYAAAGALAAVAGEPKVQAALLGQLTDADSSGRYAAAGALAAVAGEPKVQAALLGRLTDADSSVRYAAAGALAAV